MRKKPESKPPELLFPPSTHVSAAEFLKKLKIKDSAGRSIALNELALAARVEHKSRYSSYSDSSDSDLSDDSSDRDVGRVGRLIGKAPIYVVQGDERECQHHVDVLRQVCDLVARDLGTIDVGLDAVSGSLAASTGAAALRRLTIATFVAERLTAQPVASTSEKQWISVLKKAASMFETQASTILTLRPEGTEEPGRTTVYPLWLLEVLFVLQDKVRVSRRVIVS